MLRFFSPPLGDRDPPTVCQMTAARVSSGLGDSSEARFYTPPPPPRGGGV